MDAGMLQVQRSECKYCLNYDQIAVLLLELEQLLIPDEFSKDGSYTVRSLYFDSINNTDYIEKLDPLLR